MSDIPKCTSWRGHHFVARYSVSAPTFSGTPGAAELTALALVNDNENKTYERDICVRCGFTVERKNTT